MCLRKRSQRLIAGPDAGLCSPRYPAAAIADAKGIVEGGGPAITIVESMDSTRTEAGVPNRLMTAFASAQMVVSTHGLESAERRGMGSTAIAAVKDGELLHICHVGDSRAYHLSGGRFRRVTNDHSWVWTLVETGVLTPGQARSHALRGRLLQAIGCIEGIKPELTTVSLRAGDRVLLCSDGLWESLSDDDLRESVASVGSVRDLATDLVDRANAAGGQDNITAILYQHNGEREPGAG